MPIVRLFASAALVLAVAGCQGDAQQVSQDRMVRFFDDLVFGTDYALERHNPETIQKWTVPIRLDVVGVGAARHDAALKAQVHRIMALTNADFAVLATPSPSHNLRVRLVAEDSFLINREYVPCYASIWTNSGEIQSVDIIISEQDKNMFERCIAHELMHAFGFPNHSGVIKSVMSPLYRTTELTPWDELALHALYDPRLQPGMPRDVAMPIAREIIREAMSGGGFARDQATLISRP